MERKHILTTQELADYLKLNEKTIIKKAQSGEIPGVKVGGQWRFNLLAIDAYLKGRTVESPRDVLSSEFINAAHDIIPLSRLTEESCINLNLRSATPSELLRELAETAKRAKITDSEDELFKELKEREEMLSTAIGNGIAIPHPRYPNPDLFRKPSVIIARSEQGIDFYAPDDKKVHLFFMTCAPGVVVHLKLLAKIANLLHAKDIFKKFMSATSKTEVFKILLETERINIRSTEETYT